MYLSNMTRQDSVYPRSSTCVTNLTKNGSKCLHTVAHEAEKCSVDLIDGLQEFTIRIFTFESELERRFGHYNEVLDCISKR